MEFYKIAPEIYHINDCVSIPNGMEFYKNLYIIAENTNKVSIPNGMEFYVKLKRFCKLQKRFNSQRDGILLAHIFPSGAEYFSFNSQRDGILQIEAANLKLKEIVSIPNGMEFYPFPPALKPIKHSFNSQRDGILRGISFDTFKSAV